jgi:hypothetical protein
MSTSLLGGLADRLVLLAGTLAGGCVPGFVAQYRQRLGGRLDQVVLDLAPFREIATRFHGGSLEELVRHHLASSDPTFHAEGQAIQAMVDAESRLRTLQQGLQGGIWEQLRFLLPHHDTDLLRATWQDYIPSVTLDGQGIVVALAIGAAIWLVFLAFAWAIRSGFRAARTGASRGVRAS